MAQTTYDDRLKQEFGTIIDSLDIDDRQKQFLRARWLDQVVWMEGKAKSTQTYYYLLRLITIIVGVLVPVLIGLDVPACITAPLAVSVAMSAAVEEFFHYGERWRHYRNTVELLKSEGWNFFQRIGQYRDFPSDAEACQAFVTQVEQIIRLDVEKYITEVVRAQGKGEENRSPS